MLNIRKHKKIYYVPGIFSLLVIPIVFWYYGTEYIKENDFRVISFNMPPKDYSKRPEFVEILKDLKFKSIIVPPNFSDKTENHFFNLVKELQKNDIDKTGIKFQLTNQNTYADLVKLLNIMEKTGQGRYGLNIEGNSFEIIHIKKIKEDVMMCGTSSAMVNFENTKSENKFNLFFQKLPNYTFPIIIGYFLLILCAIFKPKIVLKV